MVCGQSGSQPDALRGVAKGNTMNKLVKGSIAGAAGIALLLGGAGTFALWNDTETISSQKITTGNMELDATTPTWSNVTKTPAVPIEDINAFEVVPGHALTRTQTLTLSGTGNNLTADLTHSALSS